MTLNKFSAAAVAVCFTDLIMANTLLIHLALLASHDFLSIRSPNIKGHLHTLAMEGKEGQRR